MDSAKRCRDQAVECLRLMQSAKSEPEAKILRDIAQSLDPARQSDRTIHRFRQTSRSAPAEGERSKPLGPRVSFTRSPNIHSEPGKLFVSPGE